MHCCQSVCIVCLYISKATTHAEDVLIISPTFIARGPGVITFQSPVPMAMAPDVLEELYTYSEHYSGTTLERPPLHAWEQHFGRYTGVAFILRGCFVHKLFIWDLGAWPLYTEVALFRVAVTRVPL